MLQPVKHLVNTIQIILIGIATIISGTLALFNRLIPKDRLFYRISHNLWGPALLAIAAVRLKVHHQEPISSDRPAIYVANHLSHYDIPAVFTAIPVALHFIAKKELKKVPFLGWAMSAVGMIFIDRKDKERAIASMNKAGRLIRDGKNVISFPEGTRSSDGELQQFKKGVFVMAQKTGVDVIPVGIRGSEKVLPRGKTMLRSHPISIRTGTRISSAWIEEHSLQEFMERTRREVHELSNHDSVEITSH